MQRLIVIAAATLIGGGCFLDRSVVPVGNEPGMDATVGQDADLEPDAGRDLCPDDPAKTDPGVCGCGTLDVDGDGDDVFDCEDCAPDDPARFPGNIERCDGADEDCDGNVDEGACDAGCADGTREGFVDEGDYPDIAACAGAWDVPGLVAERADPRCAGDEPPSDCAVELCQLGWEICGAPADVEARSAGRGCASDIAAGDFFATRQSGMGGSKCEPTGSNDLFGCGGADVGRAPHGSCDPLNRTSGNRPPCESFHPDWSCPLESAPPEEKNDELNRVTKIGPGGGGVLCCRIP